MKKINLLLSISALTFALTAHTQDSSSSNDTRSFLQFGLKAGVNFSNVYDEKGEAFRADGKIGGVGGIFISIPIGNYIGVQPEVLLSQKGFKGTGIILGGKYEYTHTTNYLDLPLYFSVKPSKYITVLAGPQFSFLLSTKDVFASGVTTIQQEEEFLNDNVRKNLVSFSIGADINIQHFVLGARAAWDFLDNKGDGTSTTPRYKNQWLQLTVGYTFYAGDK